VAVLALAGCGGGGGSDGKTPASLQRLVGPAFSFSVPEGWQVSRTPRSVTASPKKDGQELVSVTVFQLGRPFRPAQWERVVRELDRVARQLAVRLKGKLRSATTVRVAGLRARQYEIDYAVKGEELTQRLTFTLRHRQEFQLLCRWLRPPSDEIRDGCDTAARTFRPS
jgi:G3E family GTPase